MIEVSYNVMIVLRALLMISSAVAVVTANIIAYSIYQKRKANGQITERGTEKKKPAKGKVIALVIGIVLWLAVIAANVIFKVFRFTGLTGII